MEEQSTLTDVQQWAENTYGQSKLADERLTKRLISYAGVQALEPKASTAKACPTSAEREGAYRFLENERVKASEIIEGPIAHTVSRCRGLRRVLAIQDTSSVEVKNQLLREALQEEGSPTGWHTHVALAVDPERREPIGVLAQQNWIREPQSERRRKQREQGPGIVGKESERWQQTAEQVHQAFTDSDVEVITVADREADIYELLAYHQQAGQGFVIRAKHARKVADRDPIVGDIFEAVSQAPLLGTRVVEVAQRGGQKAGNGQKARAGRKKSSIETQVRSCQVRLSQPQNLSTDLPATLTVTLVEARSAELDAKGKPLLHWVLLYSEPVNSLEHAYQALHYYECRWLIEELFKAWKTGCRLEERPLQTIDAVERMMAILLPIAVRLLQLRVLKELDSDDHHASCEVVFDQDHWQCLWLHTESEPLPLNPPNCRWAYFALAKLGGFYDSKKTGRAGWATLWDGLNKLHNLVSGFRLGKSFAASGAKM